MKHFTLYLVAFFVAVAVGAGVGWLREHDLRVIEEERSRLALDSFAEAAAVADSIATERQLREEESGELLAEVDRLRRELQIEAVRLEEVEREAATETAATIETLREQLAGDRLRLLEEVEVAHSEEVEVLAAQLEVQVALTTVAEQERDVWRSRYEVVLEENVATRTALDQAQAALNARLEQLDDPWYSPIVTVAKYVAVGAAGYAAGSAR